MRRKTHDSLLMESCYALYVCCPSATSGYARCCHAMPKLVVSSGPCMHSAALMRCSVRYCPPGAARPIMTTVWVSCAR